MRVRILVAAAVVTATCAAVNIAAASSLNGLTTDNLGAAKGSVTTCDGSVSTSYTLGANNTIASVTVNGIADNCIGGRIKVQLANASGASLGAGPASTQTVADDAGTDNNSETVAIAGSPNQAAASVDKVFVLIVGPFPP